MYNELLKPMNTTSPGTGETPDWPTPDAVLLATSSLDVAAHLHQIDVQWGVPAGSGLPDSERISAWLARILVLLDEPPAELSLRLVSETEMAALNETWRHKTGPTNVLSFPAGLADEEGRILLGDLAVCTAVVAREASEQDKPFEAHFVHMLVHGILHLKGYNHVRDDEAKKMESREVHLMRELGYPDPYEGGG